MMTDFLMQPIITLMSAWMCSIGKTAIWLGTAVFWELFISSIRGVSDSSDCSGVVLPDELQHIIVKVFMMLSRIVWLFKVGKILCVFWNYNCKPCNIKIFSTLFLSFNEVMQRKEEIKPSSVSHCGSHSPQDQWTFIEQWAKAETLRHHKHSLWVDYCSVLSTVGLQYTRER